MTEQMEPEVLKAPKVIREKREIPVMMEQMDRMDSVDKKETLVQEAQLALPDQMEMMDKEDQSAHKVLKEIQVRQGETGMMEETDRTELLACLLYTSPSPRD